MDVAIINNHLIKLGLDPSLLGFRYMADYLNLIDEVKDPVYLQITAAYRTIAKLRNTTATRVERNMRTAIAQYYNTHAEYANMLMPNVFKGGMSVGSFMARLWYYVKQDVGYYPDGSCWTVNPIDSYFMRYEVRIFTAGGNYQAYTGTREECTNYIRKGMKAYVV